MIEKNQLRPSKRPVPMTAFEQAGVKRTVMGVPREEGDRTIVRTPLVRASSRVHENRPRVTLTFLAIREQSDRDRANNTYPAARIVDYPMEMN